MFLFVILSCLLTRGLGLSGDTRPDEDEQETWRLRGGGDDFPSDTKFLLTDLAMLAAQQPDRQGQGRCQAFVDRVEDAIQALFMFWP